ncbi:S8 family serine peptidase [Nonomuraea sp. NPDC049607]|uniref:S8 family peptidase n=1 Tax=Nonomuraea sp. NPDC049607 TaxID=3154732 RepID=UPI0034211F34
MHWSAHVTVAGVTTAALLSSPLSAAAAAPEPAGGSVHRVTLITGDVVTVREAEAGRRAVEVKPGPGRERMAFSTTEENGELRVLPSDIVPFLAAKRLDPSLFSVTRLIAQGYDDAKTDKLPLLFLYDGSAPKTATAPELESVNGRAVAADKRTIGQLWKSLDEPRATLSQGVTKIWLDAKVKATLDHSVPQVGAPEAWQAGFDGKGVKVAVLDTGVDATHPDLAGRVKQSKVFTGEPSVQDGNGHGTHVAATIAGGDGRKGVAPGAELMVGKVLGDDGSGMLSGVIEGMEWAAAEGASVINMSLGGGATDGTDPLSLAVDTLTERTGVLFVVAAGNDGAAYSIGTPGAATSALTVGAVDGKDALAEFSSRGPRLDDAPKPDLTAPGVAIVAARAAGTSMGEPVDERYTAASGTSMATPHVAGAAAIVKQRHPDWTARQIKDALVGSAKPIAGQPIDDAGAGRLDVARAVRQGVTATGVVDLGKHQQGDGPATAGGTITYTNGTAAPVTLELAATLEGAELSARSVTVAAGGTADVKVTVNLAALSFGRYGGLVTATAGAEQVHTTLALTWKGPQHKVRFTAIDAAGNRTGADTLSMFGASQLDDVFTWLPEDGLTVEVSEGTYMTQSLNLGSGWGRMHPRDGMVVIPELKVDRDLDVVLDFRKTTPVTIRTKEPAEQVGIYTYFTYRAFGSRKISQGVMNFDVIEGLNVSPTQPVRDGSFEFASRWQLVAPKLTARVPGAESFPMGFLGRSPGVDGRHMWRLSDGAAGSKGKAAVIRSEDIDWADPSGAAIKAGAAAVVLVLPPDDAFGHGWRPLGADLPIPALVVANDDGRRMLERMTKGNAKLEVTGQMDSPYLYDVMQVSEGRVPDKIVYEVSDRNTARVDTTYADNGGFAWAKEQRFGWRPWQSYSLGQQMETQRIVKTPLRRTEYVSANGSYWQHLVNHQYVWDDMGRLLDGMTEQPRTYQPGARTGESWHAPVVRPAIPAWLKPSTREGDTMDLRIPEFVDSSGHVSRAGVDNDTASARFYRDGKLVAEGDAAWGAFPAAPQEAAYRLELSTRRTSEEWTAATATETAWTFRSKPGDGVLPLLQIDYDVRPERPGLVGFAVRHQEGVSGARAKELKLELSYDDGATWRAQPVVALGGGRYTAVVLRQHPSLRVTATDSAGNSVRQTVIKAY